MSDTRTRCPNKHPGTRGQCGLPAGHDGDHTLLVESGTPWFTPVSPLASSATPTPEPTEIEQAHRDYLYGRLIASQHEVARLAAENKRLRDMVAELVVDLPKEPR